VTRHVQRELSASTDPTMRALVASVKCFGLVDDNSVVIVSEDSFSLRRTVVTLGDTLRCTRRDITMRSLCRHDVIHNGRIAHRHNSSAFRNVAMDTISKRVSFIDEYVARLLSQCNRACLALVSVRLALCC
jgi:hypothetical protein